VEHEEWEVNTVTDKWPIKIRSQNWWLAGRTINGRRARWSAGKRERETSRVLTLALLAKPGGGRWIPKPPITVTLVRIAPRKLDDDNNEGGFKHIRDGISDTLGIDDGPDSGIEWKYGQERGEPKEYAMRITIAW
jgi:hypothetical protein